MRSMGILRLSCQNITKTRQFLMARPVGVNELPVWAVLR
jgi:hypothetical protein